MNITIRKFLSVIEKKEFVSIYDNGKEEFFGTIDECERLIPNCVLDTISFHVCNRVINGKGIMVIYKENTDE